ncbi:Sphingosine N-acyltransferase lag1 [Kickxella alabastrina]|uniref:Sphingosine N-acyltransferase lag1 n=1 Tax=Kickxella alabastrina TaxID=61397 RepID=A0ACC1I1P4_9FUNG|nr:Sphingosine N-acyltransferase lag1 [Kickxella alabastrina]
MVEQRSKPQSFIKEKAAKLEEKKKKKVSLLRKGCHWVVDNQIGLSLALLAVIHGHDYFLAKGTSPFVHLQHKIVDDDQGRYNRGRRDVYYILHWVVAFTLVRATVMYKMLEPFIKWYGVRSQHKVMRFGEQGWLTIYYIFSFATGIYVMAQGPHWMNTMQYWTDYPEGHKQMTPLMKSYYLVQMGFWFQQIFVILIEERRKDFFVMFMHHIVTCNLMGWSLFTNYVRVGNAVLCCMDFSDIFLSGTKCIRYMGFKKLTNVSFVVFILSWVYTRHYLYMKIMYSVYFESQAQLNDHMWEPENLCFYNRPIIYGFTFLLALLQMMIIYWFVLVLRIAYRSVCYSAMEDTRSDSEGGSDDENDGSSNGKPNKSKGGKTKKAKQTLQDSKKKN